MESLMADGAPLPAVWSGTVVHTVASRGASWWIGVAFQVKLHCPTLKPVTYGGECGYRDNTGLSVDDGERRQWRFDNFFQEKKTLNQNGATGADAVWEPEGPAGDQGSLVAVADATNDQSVWLIQCFTPGDRCKTPLMVGQLARSVNWRSLRTERPGLPSPLPTRRWTGPLAGLGWGRSKAGLIHCSRAASSLFAKVFPLSPHPSPAKWRRAGHGSGWAAALSCCFFTASGGECWLQRHLGLDFLHCGQPQIPLLTPMTTLTGTRHRLLWHGAFYYDTNTTNRQNTLILNRENTKGV